MKQRLIKLLEEAWWNHRHGIGPTDIPLNFAEHLLEHGAILPPCKPGDTVYTVDKIRRVYELIEWRAVEISIDSSSRIVVLEHPHHGIKTRRGCDFEAFGVSAFLDRGTATIALWNRKTGITPVTEVEK